MVSHIDIRSVKAAAQGQWQGLLSACGVDVPAKGKHGACPICGGTDRFHFIDDHGNGDWHCRQCDNPNHGDGFDLLMKVKGITVIEAAKVVSEALLLPLPEPKPARKEALKSEAQPITEKVNKLVAQSTIGQSDYLTQKGLQCPNQKLLKDGSLLLVIQALDGTITGAQVIKPSGEKRFVPGSKKKGSFIPLSPVIGTPDTIIIAEGYATALTVDQLHEGLVLAAIDEGNLPTVAKQIRERWPTVKIILAADNDWHSPEELDDKGKPKKNVGKIAAEKTAKAINGWVALPPTEHKADWDDYRQHHGIEAAKQAFSEGLYQVGENMSVSKSIVINLDEHRTKERDPLKPFIDERKNGIYYVTPKVDKESGEIINHEQWLSDSMKVIGRGRDDIEFYLIIQWEEDGTTYTEAVKTGDVGANEGWRQLKAAGLNIALNLFYVTRYRIGYNAVLKNRLAHYPLNRLAAWGLHLPNGRGDWHSREVRYLLWQNIINTRVYRGRNA
ncbi:DNA primase [Xenorhabdus ishibashii]|uniref:DNA primase n=1 Tax=Xenorhabdus ishibashii TaxID=1034471 RepID=A0A2D0K6Y2_9GAMM|nr:DNA primase [Xenorhabdus ishibashii]